MKNVLQDQLFPNFVYSAEFVTPISGVISDVYNLQTTAHSVHRSNRNGWQSPTTADIPEHQHLQNLKQEAVELSNMVLNAEGLNTEVESVNFWVNVNPTGAYNTPHFHAGADLIGVYYAKTPPNCGKLVFSRSDGVMCSRLFKNAGHKLEFAIQPEAGRFYLFVPWFFHSVEENLSSEDRISVAFNIHVY